MENFLPFFIVLFIGVFSSTIFRKFHLPWVVMLILGGVIIGPDVLNIYEANPTIEFIGEIGLIFLMFMAGIETKISSFRQFSSGIMLLSFINGFVPFLVGIFIAYLFGFGEQAELLLGTIFVSSSIAVVIPALEANGIIKTKLGRAVMTTSIIQDVASLLLLSVLLQSIAPITALPLYIFYPLLFTSIVILRFLIIKFEGYFESSKSQEDLFQQDLRAVLLILVGTVISFEILGLHPIIAGFFAGLVMSEKLESKIVIDKLRTIAYGIFVPTFFVLVGTQTDIAVFTQTGSAIVLTLAVVLGSILSKFISGTLGARAVGFNNSQSLLFGATSIPQLSTTLAVVFTATNLGIFSKQLATATITLSIVSTLIAPILMTTFANNILSPKDLKLKNK